jgi:hypothetical protein
VLEQTKARVTEERSAKAAPMTDADVRRLLAAVDEVVIAKGRKATARAAREVGLDDLKGPTGKLPGADAASRRRLLVGFHPETLADLLEA